MELQEPQFVRRVMVVDDESIIRYLLVNLLEGLGFECQAAESAVAAVGVMKKFDPDVVIADLDLGSGASGAELIAALRHKNPALGVVLLTNFLPKKVEQLSLDRVTYLHKSELKDADVLLDAIKECVGEGASGQRVLNSEQAVKIQALTEKQQEVLAAIAQGLNNAQIAQSLGVGLRAVERIVTRIFQTLGLSEKPVGSRRIEAARLYLLTVGVKR